MAAPARISWTDSDGFHEHHLARPLMRLAPRARRPKWQLETNSGALHVERATVTAYEVEGTIRFEADPSALLPALSARRGRSITYVEGQDGILIAYPSVLLDVSPGSVGSVGLDPDPNRYGFGEYSARIRLRATSGLGFAPLFGVPVQEVYLVPDGDGGYEYSDDPEGALVWVDGDGGFELAESGEAALRMILDSHGNVTLHEVY